jgi:hypothetical protein
MAGISHASFQQKNYLLCYHILHGFDCLFFSLLWRGSWQVEVKG